MTPAPARLPPCCRLLISLSVIAGSRAAAARRNRTSTRPGRRRRMANTVSATGFCSIGLQVFAGQPGEYAGDGVGQRHCQHIDQRQHEGLVRRDVPAVAGDDAGQDRDHREHAGREGQAEADQEEGADDQPGALPGDHRRDLVLLGQFLIGGRRSLDRQSPGRGRGGGLRHSDTGCAAGRGQVEREYLLLRRVADTPIGAALVFGCQRDLGGVGVAAHQRDIEVDQPW